MSLTDDTNATSDNLVINVPRLHAAYLSARAPKAVVCFDPGLAQGETAEGRGMFRPESLPFAPKQARAWVRETVSYGMQFDGPGQLAAVAAAEAAMKGKNVSGLRPDEMQELSSFSGAATPEEGAKAARDKAVKEEAAKAQALVTQAQLTLLLAWYIEERSLELKDLSQGLASQYERFGAALDGKAEDTEGIMKDADDVAETGLQAPLIDAEEAGTLPGPEVVAGILAFLPQEAALFTEDKALVAQWLEAGLTPVAFENSEYAARFPRFKGYAGLQVVTAPGWRLAGMSRPQPEKKWLDVARTVILSVS